MASRIPEEIIEEIRHQTNIVDVISEYVALEQTGQNYKGLCPFHREKTPSFVVSPAKQFFHCYGCGAGGNVFSFLIQHEKYSFPEAVQVLAARLGIRLPEKKHDAKAAQQFKRHEVLRHIHREASVYFSEVLATNPQAETVRQYLVQRGIHETMQREFSLGYALPEWDGLRKHLISRYSADLLLESGLLIQRKNGVGQYDRFRNRLIIPIHDERGQVIAFGGRALGDEMPKYLNSPESTLFHKGKVLFGLHQAKDAIRQTGFLAIAEGYFDVIVPYGAGIQNIAATMGTSLTESHLRQIQRYTKKVVLVFDSDSAGIKAAMRTLDLFLSSDLEARAAILPQGEDPDTFVRREGGESFRTALERSPLLLDFVRERILERYDISQLDQRIACANELLSIIVKIPNSIERDAQINKTADLVRITDAALKCQLEDISRSGKGRLVLPAVRKTAQAGAIPVIEQYLIKALLKDKRLITEIRGTLVPEDLSHPITRKVLEKLYMYGDKTEFEARVFDAFQDQSAQQALSGLFMQIDMVIDAEATLRDCVAQLRTKQFEHATRNLTRKVRDAQEKKDRSVLDEFLEQKNKDLWRKKQKL
ncbi:DNA primase [candidate division KSB3 bacterium]|uniref:DNA primase n=1 Tax=candidate division KSB3 bacterium TaxID=2044937 RepID=A0A2G6KDK3_9BACT|nr:MAG: DNA primase [candidate division KSB3 bacterium]